MQLVRCFRFTWFLSISDYFTVVVARYRGLCDALVGMDASFSATEMKKSLGRGLECMISTLLSTCKDHKCLGIVTFAQSMVHPGTPSRDCKKLFH